MPFDAGSECGVWAKLRKIDVGASSQKYFLSTRKSWIRHICHTTTHISQMGWRSFWDNFIVNGTVVHCTFYKEIPTKIFFSSWPFFTGVPIQIEDNEILMTKAFLGPMKHSFINESLHMKEKNNGEPTAKIFHNFQCTKYCRGVGLFM